VSVNIPLGRYALRSDANNWMVVEPKTFAEGKRAGESYDATVGFYGRLEHAIAALIDLELRSSDATSLESLYEALQGLRGRLAEALP
jgi:hypothetical protein